VAEARVGLGFDVHRWATGRELWLGGVRFESDAGLAGHSDGDVVCHAVADALLGAAVLGDVGEHFPESDPTIAGIGGGELLSRTRSLLADVGLAASSCDVTIVCEWPAIGPRRRELRDRLSDALDVPVDRVSVKATRPEGLGLVGDGIGCLAIASVVGAGGR
jgi:2-C-methyl-D-erythritol 2,4-cyclodiphosphate synthase